MIKWIITGLFLVSTYLTFKHNVGLDNQIVTKGYGKKSESISVLLDRIQWSNHYPNRINIYAKYILYAVLIAFLSNIIYQSNNFSYMLQMIIIILLVLLATHSFFSHHADKFVHHFIDKNIEYLRNKFKLESNIEKLIINKLSPRSRNSCFNFVYKNFSY